MPTEPKNKYPKKVRVILSDPDATDSSSDESLVTDRSSGKKVVREVVLAVKAGDEEVKVVQKEPERKRIPGVRMRKWGKWCSEIRDPFIKKRLWLGTYNTAEEAAKVYNAKKEEFEARKLGQNPIVASGSGYDGNNVFGSGEPGGSSFGPTQGPPVVKILGPVDVLKLERVETSKACELKKVEVGLKRARPVGFGNGVTFKTPKVEA